MSEVFYEEISGIYRLKVPFDTVYTSVFLLTAENGNIMVDCATTAYDVDNFITPALRTLGYKLSDIDTIVISHRHSDHAGGLDRLMALAPYIEVIMDTRDLGNGISTYSLPGHTLDCIGVLDERTATLITADGLQGAGVDKYRCSLKSIEAYFKTIETLRADERIQNLLFSHAYEPWFSDRAIGRNEVLERLSDCISVLKAE